MKYKYLFPLFCLLAAIDSCSLIPTPGRLDNASFNAFIRIDNKVAWSNKGLDRKNNALIDLMGQQMKMDVTKTRPFYDKSKLVQAWSDNMCNYIDTIKAYLVASTYKIDSKVADTLKIRDYSHNESLQVPEEIMLNLPAASDGTGGLAHILRARIETYRKKIITLIRPVDTNNLIMDVRTYDVFNTDIMMRETWEYYNFKDSPLIADIITLNQIKNEIKIAENAVLQKELQYTIAPKP